MLMPITNYNVPKDCCNEHTCSNKATYMDYIEYNGLKITIVLCDKHKKMAESLKGEDLVREYGKVPIFKVRRINDAQVEFECPNCGDLNRHGWPKGEDRAGHRVSHCSCWTSGYYIEMEEIER